MSTPPVEAPPLSGRKHSRSGASVDARAKTKEAAAAPAPSPPPPPPLSSSDCTSGVDSSEKGGGDKVDDAHGEGGNAGNEEEEDGADPDGEEAGELNEAEGPTGSESTGIHVPPTARRVRLTLGQKREVVDLAASKKFTHRELAQKFRVGRTTITNICRQEDLIRTETDSADATKKKRKTTRCSYDLRVLDECLHKWRMEVRVSSPDTKLTGTVLQQKAMDIACKIQRDPFAELPERVSQALAKFSASNGWLDGYRTRFGSFSSKHHSSHQPGGGGGDYSSAIKNVDIQTRLRELHHSLHNVELQDIWTGSEFAVMSQPPSASESNNTSSISSNGTNSGNAADGGRSTGHARGRYTVSLFVNAAGETFDLQVIGTDRCPLVLRGIDTQKIFRVHYGYSKTGWQVAHTTVSVLKALNARARARKRTFRVILDSAVPHVKAAMILDSQGDQRTFFVYDHLQIYFLPPNFKPPRFHPCHLGLVQAFKARFRYELVETLFAQYRQNVHLTTHQPHGHHAQPDHLTNLTRVLHARNVFHWLHVALESLDKDLIQHCWLHSGLLPATALATLNTEVTAKLQANDIVTTNRSSLSQTMVAAMNTAGIPNAHTLCRDLQALLSDIGQLAPEFLRWLGVPFAGGGGEAASDGSPNAVAYTEIEGNAAVTDPGIDEVQLIRSVLQKHGMLSTTKLDDASHPDGQGESLDDVALEQPPRHEEVLVGVEILKKYLRLSGDAVPNRVQAIVELNRIKHAVRSAVLRDV